MKNRRIRVAVLIFAAGLFLAACGTTVQVQARFPANNPDAAQLRRVAVADFNGPEGDYFASSFEAMVGSAEFDGGRYFTLVDSGSRGHGAEARYAAEYGRRVGAEGVYFGQLASANFDNSRYEQTENRCVEKDKDGKCTRKERFVIPCLRRSFRMEVFASLVSVRSSNVVYSTRKSASSETSWCRGEAQPISDDDMANGAMNRILADIRPDIAPYNTVLHATVIEKKDGLSDADGKNFDLAVKSAGKGDMREACRLWGDVAAANPAHPWTAYNLGICAEANGDFSGALARYERARTLAPVANNDINESINRAHSLVAAQQELKRSQKPRK